MTSHRPENIDPAVRLSYIKHEPDHDELPPLLYYTTCIARSSDPTTWGEEMGSDYWLNVWSHPELPSGSSSAVFTVDEAKTEATRLVEAISDMDIPPMRGLDEILADVQRKQAVKVNIPEPLFNELWDDGSLDRTMQRFDFGMLGELRREDRILPILPIGDKYKLELPPPKNKINEYWDTWMPRRIDSPGLIGPRSTYSKMLDSSRTQLTPVQPPAETPTAVIPVTQPTSADAPTQLLPIVPPPKVMELFAHPPYRNPEHPNDQEPTRPWKLQPPGGST